ncbi:MAG: capsular polysaccharide synthesis protein [Eubacteriales bacterium]|nr:capsular polysaccharide synthesis protein [Eubacteriales bacterium]
MADAVLRRIKEHTFFYELAGVVIEKAGFANRYMGGINAMYKVYNKLYKKYSKKIGKVQFNKYSENQEECVYICWLQGIENAPELVQSCYQSMKHHITDKKIVVITAENYSQYVTLPDFIIEKWKKGIISNTHFSDILRLELLIEHGGIWLDSTVYLTDSLPSYITDSELFVYRAGWFDYELVNMGSWLIRSTPNNIILNETQNLLFKYWESHNYICQYFLLHLFFKMVCEEYTDEWSNVPYFNQIDQHLLAQEINKKFDEKRFNQIKSITSVHKLTNKINNIDFEKDSYYSKLSEIYK